jgi:hypothetical protein
MLLLLSRMLSRTASRYVRLQQLAKADAPESPPQIDSVNSLAAISSRSIGSYGGSPSYEQPHQPPTSPDDQVYVVRWQLTACGMCLIGILRRQSLNRCSREMKLSWSCERRTSSWNTGSNLWHSRWHADAVRLVANVDPVRLQLEPVVVDAEDNGVLSELQAKESELQDHLIFRQVLSHTSCTI